MLKLIGLELVKTFTRKRTVVPLAAIGAAVVLSAVGFHYAPMKMMLRMLEVLGHKVAGKEQLLNGYLLCSRMMYPFIFVFIPFFVASFSGELVGGEIQAGTMRMVLSRPVERWKLFAAKQVVAWAYVLVLVLTLAAFSVSVGVLAFGTGDLYDAQVDGLRFGGVSVLPAQMVPRRLFFAYVVSAYGLCSVASLAMLVSALSSNGATATVVACAVYFGLVVLRMVPSLEGIQSYLLVTHVESWRLLLAPEVRWGDFARSLVYLTAATAHLSLSGMVAFSLRDIEG